jgi:serine protease Do
MGIGFAIPINNAVAAADALSRPRGFLGVSLASLDPRAANYLGIKGGSLITRIQSNSPASRAGLAKLDIIYKFDGKDVTPDTDLLREIGQRPPGQTVNIQFIRDEKPTEVRIVLGERPNNFLPENNSTAATPPNDTIAGMKVVPVPDADREALRLTKGGLVVTGVEPNTPAASVGLQEGDIILRINGRLPTSSEEALAAVADSRNGSCTLHVRRNNATRLFVVDVSQR